MGVGALRVGSDSCSERTVRELEVRMNVEELLYLRVKDCPNKGRGACAFVHTCVSYQSDGPVIDPDHPHIRGVMR